MCVCMYVCMQAETRFSLTALDTPLHLHACMCVYVCMQAETRFSLTALDTPLYLCARLGSHGLHLLLLSAYTTLAALPATSASATSAAFALPLAAAPATALALATSSSGGIGRQARLLLPCTLYLPWLVLRIERVRIEGTLVLISPSVSRAPVGRDDWVGHLGTRVCVHVCICMRAYV